MLFFIKGNKPLIMQTVILTFAYLMTFVWALALLWAVTSEILVIVNNKIRVKFRIKISFDKVYRRLQSSQHKKISLQKFSVNSEKLLAQKAA
jgi:hypothetical protein